MITTITLERLKRKGYKPLLDVYYELNPSFLRTAVYENRLACPEERRVRWCERRTSLAEAGEAVYSISTSNYSTIIS